MLWKLDSGLEGQLGGMTVESSSIGKLRYAMAVARNLWGFIESRDHRVMRRMNRWRAPRWIRYWMIAATRMGDGWLWYGLGVMLLIFGGPQRFAAVERPALPALSASSCSKPSRG